MTTTLTLPDLAVQINQEHQRAETAARSAIQHALAAGRLLLEAKGQVEHGNWLGWLDENFEGSRRTAQSYTRLARRWAQLAAKAQSTAHLSVDGALKLLRDERKPSKADQPVDVGEWINAAAAELRELVDQRTPEREQELVKSIITWDNLVRHGADWCEQAVLDEVTLREARIVELDRWLEAVGKACRARVAELEGADWPLPQIENGKSYHAAGDNGAYAEIAPHEQPGFCYVGVYQDTDTDNGYVDYMKRGIRTDAIPQALEHMGFRQSTDWSESPHDGEAPWYVTAPGRPGRVPCGR